MYAKIVSYTQQCLRIISILTNKCQACCTFAIKFIKSTCTQESGWDDSGLSYLSSRVRQQLKEICLLRVKDQSHFKISIQAHNFN
jgi:hypothetical protein